MPDYLERFRTFHGDYLYPGTVRQNRRKVHQLTINLAGNGSLGKTDANGSGQVIDRCPFLQSLFSPIRQRYFYLTHVNGPLTERGTEPRCPR